MSGTEFALLAIVAGELVIIAGLLVAAVVYWHDARATARRTAALVEELTRQLGLLRDAILGARPAGTSIELALWETEEERAYDVQLQQLALPAITECCRRLGIPLPPFPDREAERQKYAQTHPRPEA